MLLIQLEPIKQACLVKNEREGWRKGGTTIAKLEVRRRVNCCSATDSIIIWYIVIQKRHVSQR